ncbi:ROK family protein [Helcococcus kunzii]|uniref:ROK family protein n=1 Tax=Helcococcus kunzii TaxID=40091 RepID=UPI0021A7719A|nr:ROK family protein [Helcococcus kunzii]MCT1796466.1 ROK family protein [Helcococcus kunzii]MCT1989057.1 ROK family protein [Helcococcus kunzii]
MDVSVYLDVGGTYIKGKLIKDNRVDFDNYKEYGSKSEESKSVIIDNFINIIESLTEDESINKVDYILMAFPGPFDYKKGICKIKGLNKYASLYGLNFIEILRSALAKKHKYKYTNTKIKLINDAVAFAYGNYFKNKVEKGAYFTIGTGFGSTFISKGEIFKGKYNIPKNGMLYDEVYRGKIIDDLISNRGIVDLSKKNGLSVSSSKELYNLAEMNDENALKTFLEFGKILSEILNKYLEDYNPDEIVLAGQIVKSYKYFEKGMNLLLMDKYKKKLKINNDTSKAIMYGLYRMKERG